MKDIITMLNIELEIPFKQMRLGFEKDNLHALGYIANETNVLAIIGAITVIHYIKTYRNKISGKRQWQFDITDDNNDLRYNQHEDIKCIKAIINTPVFGINMELY